ncbi:HAND domain containing protein [Amanita muscaria]
MPCEAAAHLPVAEDSVEERMLERAAQKLRLDQLVIQQGHQQQTKTVAANKEELLEMITHGAEKIINSRQESVYHSYDDIALFTTTQQRKTLGLNLLSLSKRERKYNYSVDNYFKDTLRVGPVKPPKLPRAPKQISIQDFQFFPPGLAELQERELAVFKRLNSIPATVRESQAPEDTPEKLEEERQAAQEFIDTGESEMRLNYEYTTNIAVVVKIWKPILTWPFETRMPQGDKLLVLGYTRHFYLVSIFSCYSLVCRVLLSPSPVISRTKDSVHLYLYRRSSE